MFDMKRAYRNATAPHPDDPMVELSTPWGEALDVAHVLEEYPRPQMRRASYVNLNGLWDYAFTSATGAADKSGATDKNGADASGVDRIRALGSSQPNASPLDPPVTYEGRILVPFSPEAPLSGVRRQLQPTELLWYRRGIAQAPEPGKRVLLHFQAVDSICACYVNGTLAGTHEGGYLPFCLDVTDLLTQDEDELVVCVADPSETRPQPRGKQLLERGSIWYTAQSGIWQTVWLEVVPKAHVESLHLEASLDREELRVVAEVTTGISAGDPAMAPAQVTTGISAGDPAMAPAQVTTGVSAASRRLSVEVSDGAGFSACGEVEVTVGDGATVTAEVRVQVPSPRPWTPDDPFLYQVKVAYGDDLVESYCAFRTFSVERDGHGVRRFCLNHRPLFLRGILDQGYWSDGLMTAPADEALVYDIEVACDLGFNMVRKHIKVESERWYYHCDRLGMIVWQDMVNGGSPYQMHYVNHIPTVLPLISMLVNDRWRLQRFGSESDEYRRMWPKHSLGVVDHLRDHPCIATWTVFNEGWGQFRARQMTELLREADPTRPLDEASGWFYQGGGDFWSVHNYFRDLRVPWGKRIHASVISEFGGLTLHVDGHSAVERTYGYVTFGSVEEYRLALEAMLAEVDALERKGLSGYVYTQLTDVEEEVNGLVTYDRRLMKAQARR